MSTKPAIEISDYNTLEELYKDVDGYILALCKLFAKKYGGDVEEHFANAGTLFLRAFNAYDPDKGAAFTSVLRNHVWYGLFDILRMAARTNARLPQYQGDPEDHLQMAIGEEHFDLPQFKRQLSRDAAIVIHMLLFGNGTQLTRAKAGWDKRKFID